jgi:hypothetical protein
MSAIPDRLLLSALCFLEMPIGQLLLNNKLFADPAIEKERMLLTEIRLRQNK